MSSPLADDGREESAVPSDERATLSWERTAMALVVATAGTAKHTWSDLGLVALLPLVPLVLVFVWVLFEGWRRYEDDRYFKVYRAIGGPTFVLAATIALAAALEASHLFRR